jgi:ABC-type multidrug transport system fused ATPase/permease subunit
VISQKMQWFDTTPVGRVVSRFAKDIAAVDERLAMMFNGVIGMFMMMGQTIVVIGSVTGYSFLVVASPVVALYLW